MGQEPTFVGIDVIRARVDVAVRPGGDIWSVDYDETGVRDWWTDCSPWDRLRWSWRLPAE